MPVRVNGIEMSMLELIESVEIIAGAHGIGRLDDSDGRENATSEREEKRLETRRRPPWSCTWRIVSWRRWWRRPSSRGSSSELAAAYADLVRDGRWFSPTREAIDAFVRGDAAPRDRVDSAQSFQRRVSRARADLPFEWGASPDAHAADRVDRLPAEGLVS